MLLSPCLVESMAMVTLRWLPHWQAYSVRQNGRIIGLVRCKIPIPFRLPVQFV